MKKRQPTHSVVAVLAVAAAAITVSLLNPISRSGAILASAAVATAPAATLPVVKESQVEIDNFAFKPKELNIVVGTKVTWVNKDDVPHTATSSDVTPAFDSKTLDTDDKYSFTFTKPGTYKYFCKVHPHMTGVVIVK